MRHSLQEIAAELGAETQGDATLTVERLAEPGAAGPDDLAMALTPKFADQLVAGRARAAVIWPDADIGALGLEGAIVAPRGRLAMAGLTEIMDDDPVFAGLSGHHSTAVIDPTAQVPGDAVIGPLVVIGAGVVLGPGARIGPHVSIGPGARIGAGATLHAGVRIGARVHIGARFIAQPGAVIGGDGFSFTTMGPSNAERARRQRGGRPLDPPSDPEVEGRWHRIHSLGGVEIGDDVEIGANSTVDAGTIRATRIGNGVKIDNLVQVGHNVVLGADCLLCAHVAVAGSSVLGARVILGGKAGVADNLKVGRDVVAGGGAVILSDVGDGLFVSGHPAKPTHAHRAEQRALRRLVRGPGDA